MTHRETSQQGAASAAQELPAPALVGLTIGGLAVVVAGVTTIGADTLWLPALGDLIRAGHSIPDGIPFAAAPSAGWVNTTALGQLVLSAVHSVGSIGIVGAQVVAVVAALVVLAHDARSRRAGATGTSAVLVAVTVGAAGSLFVARAQLLSLVPFALLLVLLRRQHDHPSGAIWWAVPLIALWGNLHGAVLAGVAVLGCHLLLSRARTSPATAVAVGAGALAAVCLNPALGRTPDYYRGVFAGAATTDRSGMWGRLTVTDPFHVLLVVVAVALLVLALRRRPPLWELAAALGLVVATVSAARHGVWLLLFLAVPAAAALRPRHQPTTTAPPAPSPADAVPARTALTVVAVVLSVAAGTVLVLRAPGFEAADVTSARIAAATRGEVVLVAEPLAESVAAAGATVWAANPLDAFAPADQTAYLAFVRGDAAGARRALTQSDAVVAPPGSAQARLALASGLTVTTSVGPVDVYRRP